MAGGLRRTLVRPWVVMPVVAAVGLGGWFVLRPDDDAPTATSAATTEQLVEVTSGTMARRVSAEGTVAAADTEDLSFTSAGTVTAVNVAAGATVHAGDVLATLDSAELAAAVAQAEADVADAEAELASDTDDDASEAQLAADASKLAVARDALAAAQEDLAGASLVAPIDGVVASVDLVVGQQLGTGGTGATSLSGSGSGSGRSSSTLGTGSNQQAAGASSSSAQVQLISAGSYEVSLGFDDTEIDQLAEGQATTITLTTSTTGTFGGFAFPGGGGAGGFGPAAAARIAQRAANAGGGAGAAATGVLGTQATGTVASVSHVADASSGVASYPVVVAFTGSADDFHVGATATVQITVEEIPDAIQVPTLAVTTTGGVSTVEVADGSARETRTVTLGQSSGGMVQVTDGLVAGEQVVLTVPAGLGGQRGQGTAATTGAPTSTGTGAAAGPGR